jgi:hypothetical protein
MYASWALFLIFHLARFSLIAAVPIVNETVVFSSVDDCYYPEIIFSNIENRFTLTALTEQNGSWPIVMLLPGPSRNSYPYLARADLGRSLVRLTDSKLIQISFDESELFFRPRDRLPPVYDGVDEAFYYTGPRFQSDPPILEELTLSMGYKNGSKFWASYACDAKKNLFLELKTTSRKCYNRSIRFSCETIS